MRPWDKTEIKKLDYLQSIGTSIDDMAEKLGRSREAIKIKLGREKFEKIRVCRDCGKKIFNAHFNRQRCSTCSKKHTDERKIVISSEYHLKNKERINNKRLLERWGNTREIVLKRDGEKCVECGLSREDHFKKYNKDIVVYNPNVKNRQDRNYIKDDPKELITVCLCCQGKLRVKHRSKDYSMTGGRPGMKPETLAHKLMVRCQNCGGTFFIYYDPMKHYDRYRNQKCEHCGEKFNYTKREKAISFKD